MIERATSRFRIAVHRADGGFIARALDAPACVARGATEVEAVENLRGVIRTFRAISRLLDGERCMLVLEISA